MKGYWVSEKGFIRVSYWGIRVGEFFVTWWDTWSHRPCFEIGYGFYQGVNKWCYFSWDWPLSFRLKLPGRESGTREE